MSSVGMGNNNQNVIRNSTDSLQNPVEMLTLIKYQSSATHLTNLFGVWMGDHAENCLDATYNMAENG